MASKTVWKVSFDLMNSTLKNDRTINNNRPMKGVNEKHLLLDH